MKNIKLLPVLLMLGVLLVSCEKEKKNEWNKLYGYTNEQIVGTYSYSNVSDAFEGLTSNSLCHICQDARISIKVYSGSKIQFDINSASAELNASLVGPTGLNDDDFLINYEDGLYDLTAYVYTNVSGQIRLHGFVRKNRDNQPTYYFDVIKN